jgi:putative iron-dependent peroxidase
MALPQNGLFALGTLAHSYLEFGIVAGSDVRDVVAAAAGLSESHTTLGGVNLVLGLRPDLWRSLRPDRCPSDLTGYDAPVIGPDGFEMPATQCDLFIWIAAGSYDVVFDAVIELSAALDGLATVVAQTDGWTYHRDLDLTGFIDGTENPSLAEAPRLVLVPEGHPGAGGSVLLVQKWLHDSAAWTALSVGEQEQVMGRTKPDSVELADRPESSHVARTDQESFGDILRRNTAYGSAQEHGTMFVGFSATQRPLAAMLDSMAGIGGVRDALTRFARPLTGAYYFIPALDDLAVPAG